MRRRALLAAAPAATLVLPGCSNVLGDAETADPTDRQANPTPKPARPAIQNGFEFDHTESESTGESAVGSRAAATDADASIPWRVLVWNDAAEARSITVTVFGESAGRALVETIGFPANAYHTVLLFEPDEYTIQVQATDRARHEYHIAAGEFDCNSHTTEIRVAPTGDVQYVESSTLVLCGPLSTAESEDG
ncbi:hypothetical protein [Halosimplex amylolyticum]|uniref:hypothetical protein n=1 Tax=Halosimplex amylolyticum TaxID=3396616 RepID=UPI003F55EE87